MLNTDQIDWSKPVSEFVDVVFAGSRKVSLPGAVGKETLVDRRTDKPIADGATDVDDEYLTTELYVGNLWNALTADQLNVVRRQVTENPNLYPKNLSFADAVVKLRKDEKMSPRQPDTVLINTLMGKIAAASDGNPLTPRQQEMRVRIIAQLARGESLGKGQEHLDQAAAALSERRRERMLDRFDDAETNGQFNIALANYRAHVGEFNRSARANEVDEIASDEVSSWDEISEAITGGETESVPD